VIREPENCWPRFVRALPRIVLSSRRQLRGSPPSP
jgi:hypothetical protein